VQTGPNFESRDARRDARLLKTSAQTLGQTTGGHLSINYSPSPLHLFAVTLRIHFDSPHAPLSRWSELVTAIACRPACLATGPTRRCRWPSIGTGSNAFTIPAGHGDSAPGWAVICGWRADCCSGHPQSLRLRPNKTPRSRGPCRMVWQGPPNVGPGHRTGRPQGLLVSWQIFLAIQPQGPARAIHHAAASRGKGTGGGHGPCRPALIGRRRPVVGRWRRRLAGQRDHGADSAGIGSWIRKKQEARHRSQNNTDTGVNSGHRRCQGAPKGCW